MRRSGREFTMSLWIVVLVPTARADAKRLRVELYILRRGAMDGVYTALNPPAKMGFADPLEPPLSLSYY